MTTPAQPSPDLFFDTLTAYQKTAALTFAEYTAMQTEAGFQKPTAHSLSASVNQAVISAKK